MHFVDFKDSMRCCQSYPNKRFSLKLFDYCHNLQADNCLCAWWPSLTKRLVNKRSDVVGCVGVAPVCVVCRSDGGGVKWAPLEYFVSQEAAGLPILVTQQRVDERVTCCLAVGQAFGQHTPMWAYGPRAEELYNSTSNQGKREEKSKTPSTS